jgi:hypothetical protein
MAVKASGTLSLEGDVVGEFGGARPHSLSEYYRGGGLVPDAAIANGNVPLSGAISFSDFYGSKRLETTLFSIPAFSTTSFNAGDGQISYRLLGSFTIPEPKTFSFSVNVTIRGDERESSTFASTNTMLVRNPTISIYRGGTVFNGSTTPPTGTLILSRTSFVQNETDNFNTTTTISGGPSTPTVPSATFFVVASMFCQRNGGPDAPAAIWINPAFNVVGVTG